MEAKNKYLDGSMTVGEDAASGGGPYAVRVVRAWAKSHRGRITHVWGPQADIDGDGYGPTAGIRSCHGCNARNSSGSGSFERCAGLWATAERFETALGSIFQVPLLGAGDSIGGMRTPSGGHAMCTVPSHCF
jgi:hypothetical protein